MYLVPLRVPCLFGCEGMCCCLWFYVSWGYLGIWVSRVSVLCICMCVSLCTGWVCNPHVWVSSVSEWVSSYWVCVSCTLGMPLCVGRLYVFQYCDLHVFMGSICVPLGLVVPVSHRCSVQLATLGTTVRRMWTSVPPSPARTGASASTSWPAISAPVPQGRWVRQGQGWGTGREPGSPSFPDCSLTFPSPRRPL